MRNILLFLFLWIQQQSCTRTPLIRNMEFPICMNCIHFIQNHPNAKRSLDLSLRNVEKQSFSDQHANNYPNSGLYGKCKQFGEINLVSGEVTYDFASICRDNGKKCGTTGQRYEEKNEKLFLWTMCDPE